MKEKITKINRTLFELETGILIYGAVCQIFVFLPEDKAKYSLGLWMGVLIAAVSAFHMWWSLDRALDLGERGAGGRLLVRKKAENGVTVAVALAEWGSGACRRRGEWTGWQK